MEDLTGQRFGKLVCLYPGEKSRSGRTTWVCKCDCGNEKTAVTSSLKTGDTRSCGCDHYKSLPRRSLTGQKFGRLTVIEYLTGSQYRCLCDCGKETIVKTYSLTKGLVRSCGCLRREVAAQKATKHGGANDPLYHVLNTMHQRCENPNCYDYKWYGAEGVTVCSEWALTNFLAFKEWAISSGYQPGLTIDRVNPFDNYNPNNCRWITIQEQQSNRRNCLRWRKE